MNYVIKPLSPELTRTFTGYLSNLDFSHSPHWATCFCRYYHSSCSMEQWQKRTGEENCAEAVEQIKTGNMKGYLAFDAERCIGWRNANNIHQFIRLEDDLKHIVKDKKVGCVICFVIHPEYRRHGVARLLLKQVVNDFKSQNFDAVLAIPFENANPQKLYRGTMNMYKELGFEIVEQHEESCVMQLKL